jgi:hypothetical protein
MTFETNHSTDTADMPTAWRCIWQLSGGHKLQSRSYRPRPQEQRYPTRAAAEACKAELKQRYGADVVICIVPAFIAKKHPDEPTHRLAAVTGRGTT